MSQGLESGRITQIRQNALTMDGRRTRSAVRRLDFWPGLSRLWWQGSVGGLLASIGFAALLNITIISTFLWQELCPPGIVVAMWSGVLLFWTLGLVDSYRIRNDPAEQEGQDSQLDLFLAARGEYLKGNWSVAEHTLGQILKADPRDVEARLMLATLLRHQGRLEPAKEQLRKLQCLRRAAHWNMEIKTEWQKLNLIEASDQHATESTAESIQDKNVTLPRAA